jgi:WD40 repeat protein
MNARVMGAWYDELSQTVFAVSNHVEHGDSLIAQSLGQEDVPSKTIITFDQGRDWFFSPQGDYLAVSKYNGDLQLWSLDGNLEASFVGHQGTIDRVHFSPDGSQILTYSKTDKTVRLWDLQGR